MKRLHLSLFIAILGLTFLLLWTPALSARAETYGVLSYTVSDEQVTITKCEYAVTGEVVIPDTIDGYPVTTIGDNCFAYCIDLTSVVIPDSVTTIEKNAFRYCRKLTAVTIPASVTSVEAYAFAECSKLTDVTICGGTIGDYVFYKCPALTTVTISANVTAIGDYNFYNCYDLTDVYIEDMAAWCSISFASMDANPLYQGENLYLNNELVTELVVPEEITGINAYAFYRYPQLTSVVIPDNVTYIGECAFAHCSNLASVVIGDGVTNMGLECFGYCSLLTEFTFGSGVTEVPEDCFYECESLETIVLPDNIQSIGSSAFGKCTSLKEITIPDTVTRIADRAFISCRSLEEIVVPEGITTIEDYTFDGCSKLATITLPDSITSIGVRAFSACGMTEFTIPKAVTDIPSYAFSYCNKMTDVTISDCVTTIGDHAFNSCAILSKITIGSGVTSIGTDAFYLCRNLKTVCTTDLAAWCKIDYAGEQSFPIYFSGGELYLKDTLLTTVEIPAGIVEIKPYAFYRCTNITGVTFPSGLTSIGDHAFSYCFELKSVTLGEDIAVVGEYAFSSCSKLSSVTIAPSVTTIKAGAFSLCYKITKVNITDLTAWCNIDFAGVAANPTTNCHYLYLNNSLLTKLTIPDGITQVKNFAFSGCEKLVSVDFGNSVTSIGNNAFENCQSLTTVSIPASTTDIAANAFRNCSNLLKITVDPNNPNYTSDSSGVLFSKDLSTLIAAPGGITGEYVVPTGTESIAAEAFYMCSNLTAVTMPDTVVSLGELVFYQCDGLVTVVLSTGITSIPKQAFYDCDSLTTVTLHDGITHIHSYAFDTCRVLEVPRLPETLTYIGYMGFYGCNRITTLVVPASVTEINTNAFSNCTNLTTVEFKGSAPTIEYGIFTYVTATAYYPANDPTWTENFRRACGSTLTWIAKEPGPIQPTITLKYPTASFEDVIILNVYFAATDLDDVTEMGLITYSEAVDSPNVETAETITSGYVYAETEGLYLVSSHGIAAKDMEKSLQLAVYARLTDGSCAYSPLVSYRPSDYATNLMNTGSAEMKAMMAATLSYGGAAQGYFGQEGSLSQVDTSLIEAYRADMMDPVVRPDAGKATAFQSTGGFTRGYPTVSFEGAFSINYYFTPSNTVASDVVLYYWTAEAYAAAEDLTADNASGALTMTPSSAGEYHAAVTDIAAKDLDDTVYVACVYSDGENRYCSGVLAYSIGAYCVSQAAGSGALSELAAATAVYGYYAKQMFG